MYAGFPEAAKARIDDDIRRANSYRRGGETRKGQRSAHQARARTVARALAAALMWPIKH